MNIKKVELPDISILKTERNKYDYIDSYQIEFYDKRNNITSTEIGKSFFANGPQWIDKLFAFRNRIVVIFGLKTTGGISDRQKCLDKFNCEQGDQFGLFKVLSKTNSEVILGENDKHLNFRVSLLQEQIQNRSDTKLLTISTTVEFNNWFGRLYFLPVRPFHKLIVPTIMKEMIKNLETENKVN